MLHRWCTICLWIEICMIYTMQYEINIRHLAALFEASVSWWHSVHFWKLARNRHPVLTTSKGSGEGLIVEETRKLVLHSFTIRLVSAFSVTWWSTNHKTARHYIGLDTANQSSVFYADRSASQLIPANHWELSCSRQLGLRGRGCDGSALKSLNSISLEILAR